MGLKRVHTLYLQSKYRNTGTTSNYTITLPDVINSDANMEKFKISLLNFTTYNNFLQIKEHSNSIIINDVLFQIPNGTYTYQKLVKIISSVINAPVQWNVETNTISIIFQNEKTIRFDGIANVLGFIENIQYTGNVITSSYSMQPNPQTHIMIHLNNISPLNDQLCFSNHTGEVRIANILAKVLINASPFQLITHQQVLESDGLYCAENSLGVLEIVITDNNGIVLEDIDEHELVLKIETYDVEDYDIINIIDYLKDIKQTLKDMLLYRVLRFNKQ